jgi:hypothetical protein
MNIPGARVADAIGDVQRKSPARIFPDRRLSEDQEP